MANDLTRPPSTMAYVLVMKQTDGVLEIRDPGWTNRAALDAMSVIARDQDFDLMFVLSGELSLEDAGKRVESGEGIASHPLVEKVYSLHPERL